MADVPRLWQSVLKSSDHLTSSPAGAHNVVSCTGCSSGQLEKNRNAVQAGSTVSPHAAR